MKLLLTERFQKDLCKLSREERSRILEALLKIPAVLKNPHRNTGTGIRKLHRSGIFEARVGLDLRLVFAHQKGELILATAGSHNEVRKYLASL